MVIVSYTKSDYPSSATHTLSGRWPGSTRTSSLGELSTDWANRPLIVTLIAV